QWFLGTWGGFLYRVTDKAAACSIATEWLMQNHTKTESDVPIFIKARFSLVAVEDLPIDPAC
ncbi:MAG: hypothetical protein AAF664_18740, partial [Planctomycetota bacterium]